MVRDFPFTETRAAAVITRRFSHDADVEDLTWHRDLHDRRVRILEARGWYLQFDDELPVPLTPESVHYIPAGAWHRVVKRSDCSDLVIEITECPAHGVSVSVL